MLLFGLGMMAAGYFFYSKFIAERIYRLDPDFRTPAHEFRDGVDYVPTNKVVLWGRHFTSVAGAAPIVGPAIAVIWGWAPAFAWVILGTIFFAGVHDFGALWASIRNKGKSIGTLTGTVIGARARNLFLVVIFLLLLMVNAAFAVVIANLLVSTPTAVVPTWGAILVALVIGQLIYRYQVGLLWPSIIGVIVLYAMIWIGNSVPIVLPDNVFGLGPRSTWILLLFLYAGIASILPVWVLLQPRDYINGLQLFVGLGLLYLAVLIAAPEVVAPVFNDNVPAGTPSSVPVLETLELAAKLRATGITIGALVVNKRTPGNAGEFLAARRAQEDLHLATLVAGLPDLPRIELPLIARDIVGREALEAFAEILRGSGGC